MANTRIGAGVLSGKKLQFWMTAEQYDKFRQVRFDARCNSDSDTVRTALEVFFAVHQGSVVYKDTDGKVVFESDREAALA